MMSAEERLAEKAIDDLIGHAKERFDVASDYGFTDDEAAAFAYSDIEMAQLLWLRETGCDPRTAARILL
jgi:hypothetical protein